jgi:hypothetical protein
MIIVDYLKLAFIGLLIHVIETINCFLSCLEMEALETDFTHIAFTALVPLNSSNCFNNLHFVY